MGMATEIVNNGLHVSKNVLTPVVGVLAAGGAARTTVKAYTRVPQGYKGLRTKSLNARRMEGKHAGELYGVVESGGRWMWPYVGGIVMIDMRQRESELQIQADNDNEQIQIKSSLFWRVHDDPEYMFRSHYNVGEGTTLEKSVAGISMGGLRRIAESRSRDTLRNKNMVDELIQYECASKLRDNFGVIMNELVIHEATATAGEKNLAGQRLTANAISNLDLSVFASRSLQLPEQESRTYLREVEG